MIRYAIVFAVAGVLAGCISSSNPPPPAPAPASTVVVPPGSTVVCPAGSTCR